MTGGLGIEREVLHSKLLSVLVMSSEGKTKGLLFSLLLNPNLSSVT